MSVRRRGGEVARYPGGIVKTNTLNDKSHEMESDRQERYLGTIERQRHRQQISKCTNEMIFYSM